MKAPVLDFIELIGGEVYGVHDGLLPQTGTQLPSKAPPFLLSDRIAKNIFSVVYIWDRKSFGLAR